MTRLFDMNVGTTHEFVLALQNAGFTRENALDVIDDPSKAKLLTNALHRAYASPEEQVRMVIRFLEKYADGEKGFRAADIPLSPKFTPRSDTEQLLLTVMLPDHGSKSGLMRTFDAWWGMAYFGRGSEKSRDREVLSDPEHMRLIDGLEYEPGIRWVAFEPLAFQAVVVRKARQHAASMGVTLAHVEVLIAAALFREWSVELAKKWADHSIDMPYPNMAGIDLTDSENRHMAPVFNGTSGPNCIWLDPMWDDYPADDRVASPTVRKL
ncbi:MAG: hypothetical protein JWN12_745 [Candidatus Saccharibacteria bacterium]|nr:hypothetical protein [Candidatus Saccharibacteria bacterium]